MKDWSPQDYLAFAGERSRPQQDLLAHVLLDSPRRIYDLGCGPGNSTALLAAAYPKAEITGIDNSPAMLAAAQKALPEIAFAHGDLSTWSPPQAPDLLFSNATLQWIPDHLPALQRLLTALIAGGVLAVQMPDNLDEPSHRLMQEVARSGPWAKRLANAAAARAQLLPPDGYYAALKPHCARIEIWHSIYNHPLKGAEGIAQFFASTGLRPYLGPLDNTQRTEFLARYRARLSEAYPAQADGTVLLRFPRLFMVAVRR